MVEFAVAAIVKLLRLLDLILVPPTRFVVELEAAAAADIEEEEK